MEENRDSTVLTGLVNRAVTILCWIYFIFAFLLFFSWFYLCAFFFSRNREKHFQYLNHLFFKGFLFLLRLLAPRQQWRIDEEISRIRGSIIVCNHRSYLDPLILLSLLPRNKTIVKSVFFRAPVFGWLIAVSGYLPASTEGVNGARMIEHIENMADFFEDGGNLFVFPEGTRNRKGTLGAFHSGVFKIARMCRCPIQVLALANTDRLFCPGKFVFETRKNNVISMKILGSVSSAAAEHRVSAADLETEVRQLFQAGGPVAEAAP